MSKKDETPKKRKFRFNIMFTNGIPLTVDCDVATGHSPIDPMLLFYSNDDKPAKSDPEAKRKNTWQPFFMVNKRHMMYMSRVKL